MNVTESVDADAPDSDDLNDSYQNLSTRQRWFVFAITSLVIACAFILLMVALGGLFTLLAWPLHAWLALEWLPAFGVVVALFFAAAFVVAYYRLSTLLGETCRASVSVMAVIEGLLLHNRKAKKNTGREARTDDDSDLDGDTGTESHAKVIQFESPARKSGRRKK